LVFLKLACLILACIGRSLVCVNEFVQEQHFSFCKHILKLSNELVMQFKVSHDAVLMEAMSVKGGRVGKGPTALVLSPTRELARQTAGCLKVLLPGCGVKGMLLAKCTAAGSDFSKVDVLIATPLLLVESLQASKVRIRNLQPSCRCFCSVHMGTLPLSPFVIETTFVLER
jgi:hypothetical protein